MQLSVPYRIAGGDTDQMLEASLKINNMKDFEPDQIIHQVPELQQLLELREALKALKGPLSNVAEFRKKLQELIHNEVSSKPDVES